MIDYSENPGTLKKKQRKRSLHNLYFKEIMEGITKEIQIGDRLYVSWRDGQKQQGEVIEKRKLKRSSEIDVYEYYIHFPNFDRRLDEWVTIDRILLDIPITNDDVLDTQLTSKQNKKSTSQKRKSSYTYEQTATNTTATTTDQNGITTTATSTTASNELVAVNKEVKDFNLLQTLEKEHEEITKVKNIQSIILGK